MRQYQILSAKDEDQVYQPDDDSRILLAAALGEVRPGDRVLEVGVGSGYVSKGLLEGGIPVFLVATDINPHAAQMAYRRGIPVIRTDLCKGIRAEFDLILFNPPYLPTAPDERIDDWLEYALDGGITGRDVIERFLEEIPEVMAPGGRILLLVSSLTGKEEVESLFHRSGFGCSVIIQEKVEGGEFLLVYRAEE